MLLKFLSLLIVSCFAISCGEKKSSNILKRKNEILESSKKETAQSQFPDDNAGNSETALGHFSVKFSPIQNTLIPSGGFKIFFDLSEFKIFGEIKNLKPGIKHLQAIHVNGECPNELDDLNQDGLVDFSEGFLKFGPQLIPLDGNLSTQIEGIDYGPISDEEGKYFYQKSVDSQLLEEDLIAEDDNNFDDIVKLELGDELNLQGRVVVIYNYLNEFLLESNKTFHSFTNDKKIIPIACGMIKKID